jgi:ketosteroid isomerase-like protein
MAMSQENVEIVRQVFRAFNSEDIGRVLAFTHPEVEVEIGPEISAEPDTYRGHNGMRRYLQTFQDAMGEIRFQPERFWDVGESVVVALLLTAKGRQTSIPVEQRSGGVWRIRDGKVVRVRAYASATEALEAVGLVE